MSFKIIEVPTKENSKRIFASNEYKIDGVKFDTVDSFWKYLKSSGVIEDYKIEEI